jgi:hypothetical protein
VMMDGADADTVNQMPQKSSPSPSWPCGCVSSTTLVWGLISSANLRVNKVSGSPHLGVLGHQVGNSRLAGGRPPRALWGRSLL